jgi:hypothetical protein
MKGSLKKRQVRTDPTSNRTQPSNSTPLAANRITSFYPNIPPELTQTPTVKILPPVKGNQKPKGILGAILANDIPLLKNVLEKVGKQELNVRDSEGW